MLPTVKFCPCARDVPLCVRLKGQVKDKQFAVGNKKAPYGAKLLISKKKSGGATQSRTGLNGFANTGPTPIGYCATKVYKKLGARCV